MSGYGHLGFRSGGGSRADAAGGARLVMPALLSLTLVLPQSWAVADEPALVFAGADRAGWDLWQWSDAGLERLTDQHEAESPAVAADGRIAFADGSGRLWVRAPDGALRGVTGIEPPCAQPTWSPDGQRLAFACFRFSNRQDDGALWLADLGSGAVRELYDGPGLQKSPAWSPDGRHLAFVSGFRLTPDRVVEHLWLLELSDGAARPLLDSGGAAVNPAWSPDGRRIAFASDRSGGLDIWVLDLDDGGTTRLTQDAAYDDDPAWSPDGKVIAFQSTRGGELEIWTVPVSGGPARRLVATGDSGLRSARAPSWPQSPQGAP
jgi:TolB protein